MLNCFFSLSQGYLTSNICFRKSQEGGKINELVQKNVLLPYVTEFKYTASTSKKEKVLDCSGKQ